MSGHQLQPSSASQGAVTAYQDGPPPAEWGGGSETGPAPKSAGLGRYWLAVKRFKWLILIFGAFGVAGGYAATKLIVPQYEVQARIRLEGAEGGEGRSDRGPIRADQLLASTGWQDLLVAYAIADPVVIELGLFLSPREQADSLLFENFSVDQQRLRPGDYSLTISGNEYVLTLSPGAEAERGIVGDSIGRAVGFLWQPPSYLLARRNVIEFAVQTPREASKALVDRLGMTLNDNSSFLLLTLTGSDAQLTARTLNRWVDEFIRVATQLKKQRVSLLAGILEGQSDNASQTLASAEQALESFRVSTVTEPNERQSVTAGIEMTNSPVFVKYFEDRNLAESLARDRASLERLLSQSRSGTPITREAVLSIPLVNTDPAAEDVRRVLSEQLERETKLRRLLDTYTDEMQIVIDERAALRIVSTQNIPRTIEAYVTQLKLKETSLASTIAQSSANLKSIPTRTIEEQRLKRAVEVSDELYKNLKLKTAEAKLAEASTIPDVTLLDGAVAPLRPTRNTAAVLLLASVVASLGLGVVIAILLDHIDKRFRYPSQATDELGLFVLGAVPHVKTSKRPNATQSVQVVEAFRTIRMNVRYAADPARPFTMTITSPGPSDGKSFVASNLALSFAESGARTLLIDGDVRRGHLSQTFETESRPGIVEYLDGTALIAEVLHPVATHPNLTLMPVGARRKRAPELLATSRLTQMINQMASEYDVVIVDSPPLGAGFDAFALATATGNLAVVLRVGVSDRKMAAAKLATVDTLPVRIMGTVLNGMQLTGEYEYYAYYQDYEAFDEEPMGQLTSGSSVDLRIESKR